MSKNFIRKAVSSLFFSLSLFLLWRIFTETSQINENNQLIVLFGGLFLSILFLFVLVFTFQTDIIIEKENKSIKQKDTINEAFEEKKDSGTEIKINKIISELENVRPEKNFSEELLKLFAKEFYIVQGLVYVKNKDKFKVSGTYAVYGNKKVDEFSEGQGLPGQAAKNKKIKIITEIPEDYINVISGLGAGSPESLIFIPVISGNETIALIEAAAFESFPDDMKLFYNQLNKVLAKKFENFDDDE